MALVLRAPTADELPFGVVVVNNNHEIDTLEFFETQSESLEYAEDIVKSANKDDESVTLYAFRVIRQAGEEE